MVGCSGTLGTSGSVTGVLLWNSGSTVTTTTDEVGTVLMTKLSDWLTPLPLLPAISLIPARSMLIALLAILTLAVGVSIAVQVLPPSLLLRSDKVPLAMLMSDKSKPRTASLKVMVTCEVWPTPRFGLATTTVALGSSLSRV
ncbi:hypothetical protein D3C76_1406740 [compost metagenome]